MIKNLTGKTSNPKPLQKNSKRGAILQQIPENSSSLQTPPPKTSNRMLIEKPIPVRKPLQPVENRNTLTKIKNSGSITSNKENEPYSRNTRNQKPLIIPSKVAILEERESESQMVIESSCSDESPKGKDDVPYYEKVIEPIEIEIGPTCDLDLLLELDYGKIIEDDIFSNQPDFSNCLQHTEVKKGLRSRMIDWMIEVLANYSETTSHHTFFLAVAIFDLFLKNSPKKVKESEVHLTGIAAMFLATKYEDVYHIPLKDFVMRIGHNKFQPNEIKVREWEILQVLDYNISFPTHLNYLERLIYKKFHEDGCNMLKNIKDSAIHILKMCLYEHIFLNYTPLTLSLAVLWYCIKCYFYSLSEENSKNGNPIDLTEQENALLQSILFGCTQVNIKDLEDCIHKVNDLTYVFETRFPELQNLKKYSDEMNKSK